MSRHEKERVPVVEQDPHRVAWSRMLMRLGVQFSVFACFSTQAVRSLRTSARSQSENRRGAWLWLPLIQSLGRETSERTQLRSRQSSRPTIGGQIEQLPC